MNTHRDTLVVGVDGTERGIAAVRYAVHEARRDGADLELVHATPHSAAMAQMSPLVTGGTFRHVADHALATARHVASEAAGRDVQVRTKLHTGSRTHGLVQASEDAVAVVLGRHAGVGLRALVTGSVSTHVATRAHCPVLSVPESWHASGETGPVVVGVDESEHSVELLEAAFRAAERRAAQLVVVHAWHLPAPYDDLDIDPGSGQAWHDRALEDLEKALAPVRAGHPQMQVTVDVQHGNPASVLLGAGEDASLLMIGRRGHGAPLGFHLGGVGRLLLTRAACPVEVVPLQPRHHEHTDAALV